MSSFSADLERETSWVAWHVAKTEKILAFTGIDQVPTLVYALIQGLGMKQMKRGKNGR